MTIVEISALGAALAADAFTLGAVVGLDHRTQRQIFRISFHFGLFQSLFTLAGAIAGILLLKYLMPWDHWLVFGALAFLGVRALWNAFHEETTERKSRDLTKGMTLVLLSTSVSIDAAAAGVGLPAAHAPLALSISLIGIITALATLVAMLAAAKLRKHAGKWVEIIAGIALILIGARLLFQHLVPV